MAATHRRDTAPRSIILILCMLALAVPVAGATTELHVVRYAADGVTILDETTVDYRWLEQNLPVRGDGKTHYYLQGPVFEGDPWNPGEDTNVEEKDMGAVKGTDLADICDLVGGMKEGETVRVRASDGMSRLFPYGNVYRPDSRQGPIVVAWYRADEGYVPDYRSGMRIVFFADSSTNPSGIHAFGVSDMRECFDPNDWYFFQGQYPTTTGLSVQYVSEIIIYSDEEPTGSIQITSTPSGAAVYIDDEETGDVTPCTLSSIELGSYSIRVEKEGFAQPADKWINVVANKIAEVDFNLTPETGTITVSSTPTNASIVLDGNTTGLFTDRVLDAIPAGEHTVELSLPGYRNATRTVTVEKDEYTVIDVVLFSVNETVTEFAPEEEGEEIPRFAVLGPFEHRGWIEVAPADASTGPDGTTVEYRAPAETLGRWYLYTANRSAGAPIFAGVVPDRRYIDGTAETYAANLTPENETFSVYSPPEVSVGGLLLTTMPDENASLLTYWIGEGVLAPGLPRTVRFEGTIETARAGSARLTVVGGGNVSVALNGHTVDPLPHDAAGEGLWITEYDVLAHLNASANELLLEGDDAVVRTVVLTVTAGEEASEPPEESPEPKSPWEGVIAGIFGFLSIVFPIYGDEEETRDTPEQNTTPTPGANPGTSAPVETQPLPAVTTIPGAGTEKVAISHSGGVYVTSYPPGMTIVVDNKRLVWQTPHIVYGLREGLHSIGVEESDPHRKREDSDYRFEATSVWVYPDAITPVHLDGVTPSYKKKVRVDSEAYKGERFTVNGFFSAGTLPADLEIEGGKAWITVFQDGRYLSYNLPYSIESGKTFTIEPRSGDTVPIWIDSNPGGAAVFIDGFPTGESTPCRVEGLSPGQHRITVSKPGYLPAEDVITIPEGSSTGGSVSCTLREYASGNLLVESTVPDARIYLYGRYTGEKAPYTFTGMSIGTHEVRLVSENDSRTVEDVLVRPGETTRCQVPLKG